MHDEMQGDRWQVCISARVVFMVPRVASEGFVHELIGDRVELKNSVDMAVGGEHEGGRPGRASQGRTSLPVRVGDLLTTLKCVYCMYTAALFAFEEYDYVSRLGLNVSISCLY